MAIAIATVNILQFLFNWIEFAERM